MEKKTEGFLGEGVLKSDGLFLYIMEKVQETIGILKSRIGDVDFRVANIS